MVLTAAGVLTPLLVAAVEPAVAGPEDRFFCLDVLVQIPSWTTADSLLLSSDVSEFPNESVEPWENLDTCCCLRLPDKDFGPMSRVSLLYFFRWWWWWFTCTPLSVLEEEAPELEFSSSSLLLAEASS